MNPRQVGRIVVAMFWLQREPELMRRVQRHMLILQAEADHARQQFVFTGQSEWFDEISAGDVIPIYEVNVAAPNDPDNERVEFTRTQYSCPCCCPKKIVIDDIGGVH